jgi:hypothetical protein
MAAVWLSQDNWFLATDVIDSVWSPAGGIGVNSLAR